MTSSGPGPLKRAVFTAIAIGLFGSLTALGLELALRLYHHVVDEREAPPTDVPVGPGFEYDERLGHVDGSRDRAR